MSIPLSPPASVLGAAIEANIDELCIDLIAAQEERDRTPADSPRLAHIDDRIAECRRKIDHLLAMGELEGESIERSAIWGRSPIAPAGDLDDVA